MTHEFRAIEDDIFECVFCDRQVQEQDLWEIEDGPCIGLDHSQLLELSEVNHESR